MPKPELTEEEVFSNDIDPLDAIREIRREEGVAEEDLPVSDTDSQEAAADAAPEGEDELDNLDKDNDDKSTDTKDGENNTDSDPDNADNADAGSDNSNDNDDGRKAVDEEDPNKDLPDKEDKSAEADAEPEKLSFTANGQEFEFTQEEVLEKFEVVFAQAMDYTQKTQKMAPFRKMISALEEENISAEQLDLAIDALKGNKQALQKMMETNKIDPFELSSDADDNQDVYTPKQYGKETAQMDIEEITASIASDDEYKITVDVIDRQWDQESRSQLSSNPRMIKGLHNDIKSGLYDKVAPVAMKMKVWDGNTKSDLEYYMLAGQKVTEETDSAAAEQTVDKANKKAQAADDEFDQASSEAQNKRAASSTRTRADRNSVTNYLDDDDEKYDTWYKNLMSQ